MHLNDAYDRPYTAVPHDGNMLTTYLPDEDFDVTTCLNLTGVCWTGIWRSTGTDNLERLVWVHFYNHDHNDPVLERITPGGLAEAHDAIVAQVRQGALPPGGASPASTTTEEYAP